MKTFAVRLTTALFGVAVVGSILQLRRYLGAFATLTAAALVAVSPGAVYYSRYFIHEELFLFFTIAVVVAALRDYEKGKPLFLMLSVASAALLFATKETAFVSIGTLGLAWLVSRWWVPVNDRLVSRLLGDRNRAAMFVAIATAVFIFLNVLFYSSFFTHWEGVAGAIESLKVWSKTGTSDFHSKPLGTYVSWLLQEEAPILLLAVIGATIALFESRKNRFAVFVSAWAFGIFVAYSLIPYKTPWLMLSFVVPMAIVAGYAVQALAWRWRDLKTPAVGFLIASLAISVCAIQSLVLNFREYDNDKYPYVYTHTNREALALVETVERISQRESNMGVTITAPEYWPLPWYFRNNPRLGFAGTVAEHYAPKTAPIIIGRASPEEGQDQVRKLRTTLGDDYRELGEYTLRPGVRLALFARRDLVDRATAGD